MDPLHTWWVYHLVFIISGGLHHPRGDERGQPGADVRGLDGLDLTGGGGARGQEEPRVLNFDSIGGKVDSVSRLTKESILDLN